MDTSAAQVEAEAALPALAGAADQLVRLSWLDVRLLLRVVRPPCRSGVLGRRRYARIAADDGCTFPTGGGGGRARRDQQGSETSSAGAQVEKASRSLAGLPARRSLPVRAQVQAQARRLSAVDTR
jgi:hypothetical protein